MKSRPKLKLPKLTTLCCCTHEYGDHKAKEPHKCGEHLCVCGGFRKPISKRDPPDCFGQVATGSKSEQAESSAASNYFESVMRTTDFGGEELN